MTAQADDGVRPLGVGIGSRGEDVQGAMLKPSAANKNWVGTLPQAVYYECLLAS